MSFNLAFIFKKIIVFFIILYWIKNKIYIFYFFIIKSLEKTFDDLSTPPSFAYKISIYDFQYFLIDARFSHNDKFYLFKTQRF
jgi:hypothetical protein